jgi:hypothetical protein
MLRFCNHQTPTSSAAMTECFVLKLKLCTASAITALSELCGKDVGARIFIAYSKFFIDALRRKDSKVLQRAASG